MGVDYSGHYGIGVQVKVIDFEDENTPKEIRELDNMYEFLDETLKDGYSWFEVGEGSYTGEENSFFVKIQEPFKNGFDLTLIKDEFMEYVKSIGLTPIGEFGSIGGLEVY